MRISVIIPTYNVASCLGRAVESVLAQTYAPAEIILVEDHSTDETLRVARELEAAHEIVHVYALGSEGVSAARNYGASQATGDAITYLDADDTMEQTMLEELVRLLEETGADIAGCDFRDGDGSVVTYRGKEIVQQAILTDRDTRVWSKLYRRAAIEGVVFPEPMTIGEDMLYLLAAAVRQDLTYAVVHKRLYNYTVNPEGAMERPFTPSYMDQIRCWDLAAEILYEHDTRLLEQHPGEQHPERLLTPESYARLCAIQTVSAVLVASKLAALPPAEREQYAAEWESMLSSLARYRENRRSREYYPAGYGIKVNLLEKAPALFIAACRK